MRLDDIPDLLRGLARPARVYVAGCAGEHAGLIETLRDGADACAGLTFFGVWIPGVNGVDYAGLHETARAETIFLSPALRKSFAAGRVAFRPMSYSQAFAAYAREAADLAFAHVSAPDAAGRVSLGLAADFTPAVLGQARIKVGLVNPAMPATRGSACFDLADFDHVIDAPAPLTTYDAGAVTSVFARIAEHVAALIRDGDTLQFGLGKAQGAVLRAVADRRGLKVHAGMISDPMLGLLDADAVEAVTTGVALGGPDLYARAADDPRIRFADVGYTHAHATLAAIPRLIAINSAIEVDLFGQANAEMLDGQLVSGCGGLVDFLRGAAASEGGVPVVALPASAGGASRIVPRLDAGAVSVARADMGVVVTEHGAADLRGLALDARAEAIIGLAAPGHRDRLAAAWTAMRSRM